MLEAFVPRYDYKCQECGETFELRQGFDADPVADCPVCGSRSNRLIHSVPVVFKGSGFYVNDYGKGSGNGARSKSESDKKEKDSDSGKEKKSESDSKAKSESSKESAPAGKKD